MVISVAIAAYKGENYILEQLASITAQTILPDEIVITDDSPDDKTAEKVNEFARLSPVPIKLIKNEIRLGFADNFFKAVSHCKGDVVFLCDQDDVWETQKIEKVSPWFNDPEVSLVIHKISVVDMQLRPLQEANEDHWSYSGVYSPLTLDPWYILLGMCAAIRRDVFLCIDPALRPPNDDATVPMAHDIWAWFIGTALGKTVALPDRLTKYRQHPSNAYGAPAKLTFKKRVSRSLSTGQKNYDALSRVAHARAQALLKIDNPRLLKNAATAADFYEKLSVNQARRSHIYTTSKPRLARVSTYMKLVAQGGYRGVSDSGLGRRSMLKDLLVATIL